MVILVIMLIMLIVLFVILIPLTVIVDFDKGLDIVVINNDNDNFDDYDNNNHY